VRLPPRQDREPQRGRHHEQFTFLADAYRGDMPVPDLLALAMRLAATPCGPLYSKHVSPDRELDALLRSVAPPAN